jgi:osmotically-inducible protein OsmY
MQERDREERWESEFERDRRYGESGRQRSRESELRDREREQRGRFQGSEWRQSGERDDEWRRPSPIYSQSQRQGESWRQFGERERDEWQEPWRLGERERAERERSERERREREMGIGQSGLREGWYGQQGAYGQGSSSYGPWYGGYGQQGQSQQGQYGQQGQQGQSYYGAEQQAGQRESQQRFGPHYGRGPKGYARSKERMIEDVSQALHDDAWLDASEIEVACENNEVTLRGTVNSRQDKRRAEECAERIPGVNDVRNEIRVRSEQQGQQQQAQSSQSGATSPTTRAPGGSGRSASPNPS